MNTIQFAGGGFPFENKTLEFLQDNFNDALKGLAGIGGTGNFIVSGMVQTGNNVSAGWIYYNGELIYFEAGVKADDFIITETVENKIYQDGSTHPAYGTKHAKFGIGTSPIAFNVLRRLPSLLNMQSLITSIIGFETSVVIEGCAVSNVSNAPTTLDIAAGLVMVDNNIFSMPGYTGQYPAYANADGQWVTAQPVAGSFIKFDPYTSQDKSSVIRRAVYRTGDVLMSTVFYDRFDNTGLGKWEMKGFALMNGANGTLDIRGRSPLAYDGRGADPGNNIWDANYQAPGNFGGEKKHQLTIEELAKHRHKVKPPDSNDQVGYGKSSTGNTATEGTGINEFDSGETGGDVPHENRPPYMVLVFAQRI